MRRLALASILVPAALLAGCGTDTIQDPTAPSIAPSLKQGSQSFAYTTFDVPGATLTAAQGINPRGDVVGFADVGGQRHGFLVRDGDTTMIDYPGAAGTDARGLSPDGDIVGGYWLPGEPAVNIHGYRLTNHGEFERVDYPGHTNTIPQRVLPDGTILGCRHDENTMETMHGIVMARSGNWELEQPASMNNGATPDGRLITGLYTNMMNGRTEGYVFEDGVFTPFIVPGSTFTAAWDMNPGSEIAGVYRDASGFFHGFVRRGDDYTTLDVPGASATRAFGINPRGDVVGSYVAGGRTHAFVARRER
jgi:uncharacterized membrane protein